MPTYEFYCEKCKKAFSVVISISNYDKKKYNCPKCKGKKVKQQISSFQTVTSRKVKFYPHDVIIEERYSKST